MSNFSRSFRPANANIPIILDAEDTRETQSSRGVSKHICPECKTSSRDQPIHCIVVTSPAPPSYDSITPPQPSPGALPVPVLSLETSRCVSALSPSISSPDPYQPQPPSRALQFDPEGRPRVRFRRNAFSPLSPTSAREGGLDWDRKSYVGLGIPEAQFRPDSSPVTPGTIEENKTEDPQAASNVAQRIEQKLWKYSASRNVVKRWLLEIISWVLSAMCMAGIAGMLIYYKDERIPKWPMGLTLNAYISILSKIASAALLLPVSEALGQLKWSWFQGDNSKKMWDFEIFDNASRGPWGSLLLLVRTKGKSMAALGAAVTLFALALDPFFQQVVEYPERWRLQDAKGDIPSAVRYVPYQAGVQFEEGLEAIQLDENMVGVAHQFFYDQGLRPTMFGQGVRADIPLACPDSNCTWSEYETIGFCNECTDAVDNLEFKCLHQTMDWIQMPEQDPKTELYELYPNGTACGWYLKGDNPMLMVGYNVDHHTAHAGEILKGRAQPMYDVFTRDVLPGYPSKLNNSRNPLEHAIIVAGGTIEQIKLNATPIAHECIVSWCIKSMTSGYLEGSYTENLTSTVTNRTLGPSPWVTFPFFDDTGHQTMTDYTYNENVTVQGNSGRVYTIDNNTHVLTLSMFDDIFPSTYTVWNSTNDDDAILRDEWYRNLRVISRNLTYNPLMHDNITLQFDNLAVAMTNVLRSSPVNTEMIAGPAYAKESFVDVRWAWLSLPLALLTMTFIFLVGTIIRSSTELDTVGVWKTSAIATLLYGLPDDMQAKIAASKDQGTPRAQAKEMKVKWRPKAGWRFSGNTATSTSPTSPTSRKTTPPPGFF
ncbi:hypothetical protein K491DRAFT_610588 [Lophiostoma macrostomum CBS 122681]|uniref:DUF3176 domain containing protein n=1 Tax=Lophiostoma macrostomum CBS 122681 TaxID=1314788 RepID=A0A6A6SRB8_9PLEO|nr:hypothetical protein K491DRAFT_610588 [Lophiostoma macrostomum CBS 122681]